MRRSVNRYLGLDSTGFRMDSRFPRRNPAAHRGRFYESFDRITRIEVFNCDRKLFARTMVVEMEDVVSVEARRGLSGRVGALHQVGFQ